MTSASPATLQDLYGPRIRHLGAAIIEVTRELAKAVPPPREAPYFGLDHLNGGLDLLDHLTTKGIFRVYEFVLDLGSGLGGLACWLARCYGVRVVGADFSSDMTATASLLTRRAGLQEKVSFCAVNPQVLPFRARAFTHIWSVEVIQRMPDKCALFREAFRVVRPGGYLAIQDVMLSDSKGIPHGIRYLVPLEVYLGAIQGAGFVEVEVCDVTALQKEDPPTFRLARTRLEQLLERRFRQDVELRQLWAKLTWMQEARRSGVLQTVHIFARRPA